MHSVKGDPFAEEEDNMRGGASKIAKEELYKKYGLDKPVLVQLWNYLKCAAKGDFGVSLQLQQNRPISDIIGEKFPVSARVGLCSFFIAVLFGIPMGCFAAYYKDTWLDNIIRVIITLGISIPGFILAAVLQYLICFKLKIFPVLSSSNKLPILPILILAFSPMCYSSRLIRTSILDVINQDYITTAIAKGVGTFSLLFKHILRNAILPLVTYLGHFMGVILFGAFAIETVFSIPGIARYFEQSIQARDYPIIMATTVFLAFVLILMNLVIDIVYKIVDPRINFGKES
jgi:oligopeptide transport system permease protein